MNLDDGGGLGIASGVGVLRLAESGVGGEPGPGGLVVVDDGDPFSVTSRSALGLVGEVVRLGGSELRESLSGADRSPGEVVVRSVTDAGETLVGTIGTPGEVLVGASITGETLVRVPVAGETLIGTTAAAGKSLVGASTPATTGEALVRASTRTRKALVRTAIAGQALVRSVRATRKSLVRVTVAGKSLVRSSVAGEALVRSAADGATVAGVNRTLVLALVYPGADRDVTKTHERSSQSAWLVQPRVAARPCLGR
jgi:hypothetical protein